MHLGLRACRGKPTTIVAASAALGISYLAIFKTLLLLRFVGTVGLLATAANRLLSYNSPNVCPTFFPGLGNVLALRRSVSQYVCASRWHCTQGCSLCTT